LSAKACPGIKCLTGVNTLAYYYMAKVTAVKSFIVQAPGESEKEMNNSK
jgi:hypothetical protein